MSRKVVRLRLIMMRCVKIGRASCREGEKGAVGARAGEKEQARRWRAGREVGVIVGLVAVVSVRDRPRAANLTLHRSRLLVFSSRRRHTRLQGDWSSDVCSSDLAERSDYTHRWLMGRT